MAFGSHLDRQTLIENPTRAALVRLLRDRPGLPLGETLWRLRSIAGFETASQSRVAWHLRVLERFGLATSRRGGWWRRWYLTEGPGRGQFSALAVLQAPIPMALARLVAQTPGVAVDDLYAGFREGFSRSRQAMDHHLRHLERAGLLVAERSGRVRTFAPTPRLTLLLDAVGPRTPPTPPIQPVPPILALTSLGATTPPGLSLSFGAALAHGAMVVQVLRSQTRTEVES